MEGLINIPVTFKVFTDLSDFLNGHRSSERVAAVASRAITEWIERQNAAPDEQDDALKGGYQWKSLFLPAGTRLKITLHGQVHRAAVVGDFVIYDGLAVSPSQLVNRLAGSTRNAWKYVWLNFPGDDDWRLA